MTSTPTKPPKTVLITGCSRGLGLGLCQIFFARNWRVLAVIRSEKDLAKVKTTSSDCLVQDITQRDCVDNIKNFISAHGEGLDLLINNAGLKGNSRSLEQFDQDELTDLFNVACIGSMNCVAGSLGALKQSASPAIVQISSRLGSLKLQEEEKFKHLNTSYSYRISKAAQNMLTLCIAQELAESSNIPIIALHPGAILTGKSSKDADTSVSAASEKIFCLLKDGKFAKSQFINADGETLPW